VFGARYVLGLTELHGTPGGDLHCPQGGIIRRSSRGAGLIYVAALKISRGAWQYGTEILARCKARLCSGLHSVHGGI
jgi:hypothetical protein